MHKSASECNFKLYRKEIGVERKNGEVHIYYGYVCSNNLFASFFSVTINIHLHCWKTQNQRHAGTSSIF